MLPSRRTPGHGGPRTALSVACAAALLLTAACGAAKGPAAAANHLKCSAGGGSVASPPAGVTTMGAPINTPVQLIHGHTLAEVFTASAPILQVGAQSPTWFTTGSGYTLTLLQGAGLKGKPLSCTTITAATDNEWNVLNLSNAAPAGVYTLLMDHPTGTAQQACPGHRTDPNCSTTPLSGKKGGVIGWWSNGTGASAGAYALVDGKKNGGSFSVFYEAQ